MDFKKPSDKVFFEDLLRKQAALKSADVILGVHQHGHSVFYGRDILESIILSGTGRSVEYMTIKYDSDSDSSQLELVCAILIVLRGRYDYEPGTCG